MKVGEPKSGRIKLDFKYTVNLQNEIFAGRLQATKHKTGDWLRTLSEAELKTLTRIIDQASRDPDSADHLCSLVLTLTILEKGKPINAAQVTEVEELISTFRIILRLEILSRQGYIQLASTLSLYDDLDYQVTEQGNEIAEQLKDLIKPR